MVLGSPKGGKSAPQFELIQPLVFALLVLDVGSDRRFIPSNGRDKVSPRSKVLPRKIALTLAVDARRMDRAFALDETDHLAHGILRRNRNEHGNMIRHQMLLFDPAFLLTGQPVKDFPEMRTQLPV
jgi:hypothetical protein